MTLEELLKIKLKPKFFSFDKYYDFHILEHISDNKIDLYKMENNKELFENILKKFSIIKYYNGGETNIEVGLLIYENKPMVLYEVYKTDIYWNINILNKEFYSILSNIISLQIMSEYNKENSFEWLKKYYLTEYNFIDLEF